MPPHQNGSPLEAVLSYYTSIVTLNAEGDSMVTEETLEGLGTTGFLLHTLFGSILRLAQPIPPDQSPYLNPPGTSPPPSSESTAKPGPPVYPPSIQEPDPPVQQPPTSPELTPLLREDQSPKTNKGAAAAMAAAYTTYAESIASSNTTRSSVSNAIQRAEEASKAIKVIANTANTIDQDDEECEFLDIHDHQPQLHEIDAEECNTELTKSRLTQYLPEPGYFIAGALAGGISRTATAPFDRLKVYLLVNTETKTDTALNAIKKGPPLGAVRNAGKPIGDAVRALWRAGGFRTFFAGKSPTHHH